MISMADTFAGSSLHILNKNNGKKQIYLFLDFQHTITDLEVQKYLLLDISLSRVQTY